MIAQLASRVPHAMAQPVAVSARDAGAEPRVLFLTHTGRIGGAEMCLLALVEAVRGSVLLFQDGPLHARLLAAGAAVSLPRSRPDLRAIRRNRGLWRVLPALFGIVGLLHQIRATARRHDLVYCNSQKSFVLGALATRGGVPLLWHLHDILDLSHFGRWQIRLVVALANRCAARVVAPSRAVACAFVAAGGRGALVSLVANGVSVPHLVSGPVARQSLRQNLRRRLDLPDGFVIGVFSRLSPWKGQHVVLDALALLPDVVCIIAGDALFGEEAYARGLRQQAERLGVAARVRFLGQRDDVAMLMQAIDVVVHPSVDPEPFGLTLVEAMLAGTPVIASRAGAAEEILDGGRFGALVPPGDAAALAAAVRSCRDRPKMQADAAARLHAERQYGIDRLRGRVRRLVREVVQR